MLSGNCDATTSGMPARCSTCAMLAPGISTEPALPLSQVASVTTVGRWMRPSTSLAKALAKRSPEMTSSSPGEGCSFKP